MAKVVLPAKRAERNYRMVSLRLFKDLSFCSFDTSRIDCGLFDVRHNFFYKGSKIDWVLIEKHKILPGAFAYPLPARKEIPYAPALLRHSFADLVDILFFDYQAAVAVFVDDIALVVAEVVRFAGFGGVAVGVVVEIEAGIAQAILVYIGLAMRVERQQDIAVALEGGVYLAHHIGGSTVAGIVVGAAAFVRTKFFVRPPENGLTALQTYSFAHD